MMNKLCCLIILFVACQSSKAQINIQCNGPDLHSIYLYSMSPVGFYRVDSVDTSPTNPILLTTNLPSSNTDGGISINANLDSAAGPETMYYVNSSGYYYWNGTGWTATGNTSGSSGAVNPGGTSGYIFNLSGVSNSLYRYDGSGNGTFKSQHHRGSTV